MLAIILFLLSQLSVLSLSQALRGVLIDCGATVPSLINGLEWSRDTDYISTGIPKNLSMAVVDPTLSTVRTFPLQNNHYKKFCYAVPVQRPWKYLVRTTYFYGGVNGDANPPVFDQMVDGTFWSVVNTTDDYANGGSSYYEGVFRAVGKTMSVCVAANTYTESDTFISALEIVRLDDSLYNSTNFDSYALRLVARHSFGNNGSIIRYPDDQFDRFWEPLGESFSPAPSFDAVSVAGFWNLPPLKIFQTRLTINETRSLELLWPPESLPNATYYISLYFADETSRVFDITINGLTYYPNLMVTPAGVDVFANQWLLAGITNITLIPADGSGLGPLINAGEVFQVLPLGGRTLTRDVAALEALKNSFDSPPPDWQGDPCLPKQYTWTGVTCAGGNRIRVTSINLTSLGLSGTLSPRIANLTALTGIWLGKNNLSGTIPDLSSLRSLQILHLEDNHFSGEIPASLGSIGGLREIFLQNNNLTGQVPSSLLQKPGLSITTSPGNPFLSQPSG